MRIACDIDGVIADFNTSFRDLLKAQTGKEPKEWPPQKWHWPKDYCTKKEIDDAWRFVDSSDGEWWQDLAPLAPPKALRELAKRHDLYFLTARWGEGVKRVTEHWIADHYVIGCPTVLVGLPPDAKSKVMGALEIDVMIDDRVENVTAACESVETCLLFDQPWNRYWDVLPTNVSRVKDLREVVEKCG